MSDAEARYGWGAGFVVFRDTPSRVIRGRLQEFVQDASPEQVRAWDRCIPELQHEVREVLERDEEARRFTAILEYELPMESRRPDVVLLIRGAIAVLELKGKLRPSQADLDQASAYARDLRCYHRDCAEREVVGVIVPTRASGYLGEKCGVHIVGPDALDEFVERFASRSTEAPIEATQFLDESAYRPLPTLVEAARELFQRGELRTIHRAAAFTTPAVDEIARIIHQAARERSRHLVLVTGVPGSGKTLVGLRVAHSHFLDDLAVERKGGAPTAPAVFLSGNGPLVEVLQYELKAAGGDGKTFVRGVRDYVKTYSGKRTRVPPEHVLIFDEAQRAYDAERVRATHMRSPGFETAKSEPAEFIEFAERVPEWCVVIGLVGGGQELNGGEEAGLIQWSDAIEGAGDPSSWQVHGPASVNESFGESTIQFSESSALTLDREIRFHAARDLYRLVSNLLDGADPGTNANLVQVLEQDGYHLRITRELGVAKTYLRERYAADPDARFGLVASSRDKSLEAFGVPNDFKSTRTIRYGPWYGDAESATGAKSCRHLETCVSEFGAQGLELDAVLLAWGTDLRRVGSAWSNEMATKHMKKARVRDPHQLRLNAYRVLLTRGRDAAVIFVPPLSEMDETYDYLKASGFMLL